jgi:hypothetical protein
MPIVHFVKAFCMAGLTAWSVHILSGDIGLALLLALLPLVLGLLNVLTGPAFGLAGGVFILAIGSLAAPHLGMDGDVARVQSVVRQAIVQLRTSY